MLQGWLHCCALLAVALMPQMLLRGWSLGSAPHVLALPWLLSLPQPRFWRVPGLRKERSRKSRD